ncbi:MAG: DUF1294 domain-containing protein [Ruminococcaceae bacterium]|nr:DUF1294 domain-containing protein [Oscillospiraceae bacterium]
MPDFSRILLLYYLAANVFALLLFALDKHAARTRQWRVPELTLLAFCAAGGALGGWIGMLFFRHKTRRRKFTGTVPIFLLLHAGFLMLLWKFGLI